MTPRKAGPGRTRELDRSKIRDQRILSSYTPAQRAELVELAYKDRVSLSEYIWKVVVRHLAAKKRKR